MSFYYKFFSSVVGVFLALTACQKTTTTTEGIQSHKWRLNTEQSTLSFVTTKNKTFAEEHSIQFKQGQIDKSGSFQAAIDLNSVDTLIPIRDQRLRDILFETETYPVAVVSTLIPPGLDLSVNQNTVLPFTLDLHGTKKTFEAPVVIQTVNHQLVVVNFEPILVDAKDFALDDAINQLTKIAGLQSINYTASVDFKLTFEK